LQLQTCLLLLLCCCYCCWMLHCILLLQCIQSSKCPGCQAACTARLAATSKGAITLCCRRHAWLLLPLQHLLALLLLMLLMLLVLTQHSIVQADSCTADVQW
jgi:hypothetical protein